MGVSAVPRSGMQRLIEYAQLPWYPVVLALLLAVSVPALAEDIASVEAIEFRIPATSLAEALSQFGSQSGFQVVYAPEIARGLKSLALDGRLTIGAALEQLLRGTGITWSYVNGNTVVLRREKTKTSSAGREKPDGRGADADKAVMDEVLVTGIPEVLVTGSRVLNMDIRRSRDDTQPYVVFERAAIASSGAIDLNDFLKSRVTMNAQGESSGQFASAGGNVSQVNLRGLGANQTLILVDGHRVASGQTFGSTPAQPNLNAVPMFAIERIEVLPTTASGIYGGGATGGVVNIILRRDYEGVDSKLTYENSFHANTALRRLDLGGGFTLLDGKTNVLIAASYYDQDPLLVGDRDLVQRGRSQIMANNPAAFLPPNPPPLGATTNIRSATSGVNLTLRDGTPLNSQITFVPAGYAGTAADGGMALVANAGQYNFDLANSRQRNAVGGGGTRAGLAIGPRVESLAVTVRHQFTEDLQAFADLSASNNTSYMPAAGVFGTATIPATAPNNPFNQAIQVTYPTFSADADDFTVADYDRRAIGGVIMSLPAGWNAGLDYTLDRYRSQWFSTRPLTPAAAAAVADGTVDVLRDTNAFPVDLTPYFAPRGRILAPQVVTLHDGTLRLAGPVGSLPAGRPTLSSLIEYRDERISDALQFSSTGNFYYPSRSQQVRSVSMEATIPLVAARQDVTAVRELELQLVGRYEEFIARGAPGVIRIGESFVRDTSKTHSFDPTVGVRYRPVEDVLIRASYGTGNLPPSVTQLSERAPLDGTASDPRRGNTLASFISRGGGSPELRPEQSESWSAGLVVAPVRIPGLRVSVDYTRIAKTDNISGLTFDQMLANEEFFSDRIVRGPRLPGDPPDWPGPITSIDVRLMNIAKADIEVIDAALDYRLETRFLGQFDFYSVATWQPHYRTQVAPALPVVENAGISPASSSAIPLKFRANAGLTWTNGPWTAGWSGRYFDSYRAGTSPVTIRNQGNGGMVESQTYHDVFASYRFPDGGEGSLWSSLTDRSELVIGVKNVFNERPPLDAGNSQVLYSGFGDPRLAVYYASLRKEF